MKLIMTALFTIITATILSTNAIADSPITSTDFADAYTDEPIVVAAGEANGVLTDDLMVYLSNEYNPVDVKMALINKLGWKISGQNNSGLYLQYLMTKRGFSSEKNFFKKGKPDELLSMAYLKAMDNYFEVEEANKYAEKAVKKNRESRTFRIIASLIKAQKTMDSSWCEVYQITDRIRNNERLINDMRTRAVSIIYEYMDIYGKSCENPS